MAGGTPDAYAPQDSQAYGEQVENSAAAGGAAVEMSQVGGATADGETAGEGETGTDDIKDHGDDDRAFI